MKKRIRIRVAVTVIGILCAMLLITCAPLDIKNTIVAAATADPVWVSLNTDGYTAGAAYQSMGSQFGYSVDLSDNYAIIGAPYSAEGGTNRGAAFIFVKQSDGSWQFQQKLLSPSIGDSRFFGGAVSLTDSFAAVASTGSGVNVIEIFKRSGSTWGTPETESIGSGSKIKSIDINGDYLIAGDSTNGIVNIYHYISPNWVNEYPINGLGSQRFGYAVSIYGNYAVVGADLYAVTTPSGGAVFVYQRSGTNWNQVNLFEPLTATPNERYGLSVSISSNYFVVGARGTMKVYFYKLSGSIWQYDDSIAIQGALVGDEVAYSITLTGTSVVAGAYKTDGEKGCSYPLWNISGTWKAKDKLAYVNSTALDDFGYAVAACGHSLIIGAPMDDNSIGPDAGTVFFYQY